jgi:hypothetical protein
MVIKRGEMLFLPIIQLLMEGTVVGSPKSHLFNREAALVLKSNRRDLQIAWSASTKVT